MVWECDLVMHQGSIQLSAEGLICEGGDEGSHVWNMTCLSNCLTGVVETQVTTKVQEPSQTEQRKRAGQGGGPRKQRLGSPDGCGRWRGGRPRD